MRETLAGFSRNHAAEPHRAEPLFLGELKAGIPLGEDLRAVRDRALLLVGWWGAFRRSELVADGPHAAFLPDNEATHLSPLPSAVDSVRSALIRIFTTLMPYRPEPLSAAARNGTYVRLSQGIMDRT